MNRRRWFLVFGIAAGVLALDQFTKWLVVENLRDSPPVELIGDTVRLVYATNPGGAFSLLTNAPLFFAIMAIVVMGAIVYYARHAHSVTILGVLGLLLGGALGNFTDRLLRGDRLLHGEVVDFVDVGPWPVFNVADSAITIGAITLALLLSRAPEEPKPSGSAPSGSAPSDPAPSDPAPSDPAAADAERDAPAASRPGAAPPSGPAQAATPTPTPTPTRRP
jgi:signal peptidase II